MTQESEKGHRSWWWALPGAIGLALVMTAIMLWAPGGPTAECATCGTPNPDGTTTPTPCTPTPTFTPTATNTPTNTPTATATVNPNCDLSVSKSGSPNTVGEGGQITYTIKVKNNGGGSGYCTDLKVTDDNPSHTTCVDSSVDSSSDIDAADFDINDCEDWTTSENLDTGDEVVLKMVVKLTSAADEGDKIENEACATSPHDDVGGACDTATTKVGAPATATPTTAPTATTRPTVQPPVVPPPVAPPPVAPPAGAPLPSLIAPATGSGAETGGTSATQTLALILGLAGAGLLLVTGIAFARRTR